MLLLPAESMGKTMGKLGETGGTMGETIEKHGENGDIFASKNGDFMGFKADLGEISIKRCSINVFIGIYC